jgi:hypothetical protein
VTLLASPSSGRRRAALLTRVVTGKRLALARAGIGTSMIVRPRLVPGLLGVDSATSARMAWAVQMVGARELALGLGAWAALRSDDVRGQRLWLAAGALSDGLDAVLVGGALLRGRVSTVTGAGVVATAALAAALEVRELLAGQDRGPAGKTR